MSFPIYEPVKHVQVCVRYDHVDALTGRVTPTRDCVAITIDSFREALRKYPGIAGAVGYGKNIRPDLKAIIILEWADAVGTSSVELDNARKFIDFVRERKPLADALHYIIV